MSDVYIAMNSMKYYVVKHWPNILLILMTAGAMVMLVMSVIPHLTGKCCNL